MENLIFTLIERGFAVNTLRTAFASLDSAAFFLFEKVMGLLFDIAKVTTEEHFTDFYLGIHSRIYVVFSIYMFFRVTISLITYIVNPDAMTDKNEGVGKLVTRIVVAISILLFFPSAFKFLNDVQLHIIQDGTIQKVVLGVGGEIDSNVDNPSGIGAEIGYSVYNGVFFYEEEGEPVQIDDINNISDLVEHVNDPTGNKHEYKYHYIPFLGFALGIALTVITLGLCIDVSMRVFKLVILAIIAPIPIMSYIDPKSAKDGTFLKWLKMIFKEWADIFVKLFVIYFIVLIIQRLIIEGTGLQTNIYVKIALIVGLLFFAKQAPKFIYDALGMKMPERSIFSGVGDIMAAGAIGAGAIGTGIAAARNSAVPIDKNASVGRKALTGVRNVGAGLFSGVGAAAGSVLSGGYAAATAKDHKSKAVLDARNKHLNNVLSGNTTGAKANAFGKNLLFGYDLDREISKASAIEASSKQLKDYAMGEGVKAFSDEVMELQYVDSAGTTQTFKASLNQIEQAKQQASITGGPVVVNGADLGALNGSNVNRVTGDAKEHLGDVFMDVMDGVNNVRHGVDTASASANYRRTFSSQAKFDEKISQNQAVLGSYRVSYGNATGIGQKRAEKDRIGTIKGREKQAFTDKFNLQQKKGSSK